MKGKTLIILMLMFALGIYVISCASLSPAPQQNNQNNQNNAGGGGEPTINYVHIYGQLVSNYTTEWKVLAQRSAPLATYYGTVDTSDGSFSIRVPENSGSINVIAYKDDNNNNQYDPGEIQIYGTNLNVTTNNISNIIIVIPPLTNYSLTLNVSNNIYGLRIGIFVYDNVSSTYAYSPSTNATNFSFTVPITVPTNSTSLSYGIYVDSDNNNQFNVINIGSTSIPKEPVIVDPSITFSSTTTNSIVLTPHKVSGSIGGTPAGLNKVIVTTTYQPFLSAQDYLGISTISGGSYEIKYYTISNTNTNNNVYVIAFNDANNDNILLLEQGVSKKITNIYDEPSTNTVNFNVQPYTVHINSTGISGFNKIITYEDLLALYYIGITNVSTTPFTKTYYKEASETDSFVYLLFKDENGNGVLDVVGDSSRAEDTYIGMSIDISNQTKITNNFTFATLSVGITITNTNILTNTNLRIQNDFGAQNFGGEGHQIFDVTDTNFTINAYYISHGELKDDSTNIPLNNNPFTLTLFNDANDNLKIDSGETIDSATIDPSLGATNITF
jgi:hypothetical protein